MLDFVIVNLERTQERVYFDDITISTSNPITFFVTDYYDVVTPNTSTIMSATYLKNLFSYIVNDLSGISFSEVDFEWGYYGYRP